LKKFDSPPFPPTENRSHPHLALSIIKEGIVFLHLTHSQNYASLTINITTFQAKGAVQAMPSHIVPASNLPVSSPTPLPAYKSAFPQTCLSSSALKFGDLVLKNGRRSRSPYFFSISLFHTGALLRAISTAYA